MIEKLINNKDFEKIYELIKESQLDPMAKIINNNTIAHIAAVNNNDLIIKYLVSKYPESLEKVDGNGNSAIHILANYGYTDLLKYCLKANGNYVNVNNYNNETVLFGLCKSNNVSMLSWIIGNIKNIVINQVSNYGETILTILINKDYDMKLIDSILDKNPDLGIPKSQPPLVKAIKLGTINIVNRLISNGANVNIKPSNFKTPLIVAVEYNYIDIVKALVAAKADINYTGAEGDDNIMNIALSHRNNDIISLLLESGINLEQTNRFLETPVHYVCSFNKRTRKGLSLDIVASILYYGDLNQQNIDGDTALHYLLENWNWRDFNIILKEKELNIFAKNKDGKTPLSYVSNYDLTDFIGMITNSYLKQLKANNITIPGCKSDITNSKCMINIKKNILKTQESTISLKKVKNIGSNIKLIEGAYTNNGKFNSDLLHNIVYTLIVIKKYDNLFIPYRYSFKDKMINDKMLAITNDMYYNKSETIISDIIRIYNENFYSFLPYLILWKNRNIYYINSELEFYLQKCLLSKKVRFIYLKLTLIPSESGTHANIIIYDKKKGMLERFEPYGNVPYLDVEKLDIFLENRLGKIFKKHTNSFSYISPKLSAKTIGYQVLSNDSDNANKKLGDPFGFCLAWTLWYLEMRLQNPDTPSDILIKQSIDKILAKGGKSNNKINDFIRNYANDLDNEKNKFMTAAGIAKENAYDLVPEDTDLDKIIDNVSKEFGKLVIDRI